MRKEQAEVISAKLNKYVKKIDDRFSVEYGDDITLMVDRKFIAYFFRGDKNSFSICAAPKGYAVLIAKTEIVSKFYKKAIELIENTEKRQQKDCQQKDKKTKFVELESGNYLNVDFIRYIRKDIKSYYAILDDNGQGIDLTGKDLENVKKASEER